jgi:hypothetical protein
MKWEETGNQIYIINGNKQNHTHPQNDITVYTLYIFRAVALHVSFYYQPLHNNSQLP